MKQFRIVSATGTVQLEAAPSDATAITAALEACGITAGAAAPVPVAAR